jgi:formylglycine-generating enzyme required for sulfatase activity
VVVAVLGATACGGDAPPRAQLVVAIDTDAPVIDQILEDPSLSGDAAVDTVRIDVLDEAGTLTELQEFSISDAALLPLSFGVLPPSRAENVRLRIRAFLAVDASVGEETGRPTRDPHPTLAIDRFVIVPVPHEGVRRVRIVLASDCRGALPSFGREPKTCVDGARRDVAPTEGVEDDAGPSRAGTWPLARERPCSHEGPPGTVCVPGGVSRLGDPRLAGRKLGDLDTVPARVVHVRPFHMDRLELTVADVSPWSLDAPPPFTPADAVPGESSQAAFVHCTFGSALPPTVPLTCVDWETARALCRARGGDLPTEAQWSHAATGRGQRRWFPWGDTTPGCCAVSAGGNPNADVSACPITAPEPVGTHADAAGCGAADVSRDGVLDLAGSVREYVRDASRGLDAACWRLQGVVDDPVCDELTASGHVTRGGDWASGLGTTISAVRSTAALGPVQGVRCVYEDR